MISTELKVKLHKTFKQLLPACDMSDNQSFLMHKELFQLQRQN